ncbi:MAG: TetR/AcrR family transcriptional regulator [Beijerinckiaceae bacterium]
MPRKVAQRDDTLAPIAEVFREYGYEGATLSLISKATGLGKGSLYHFFPAGKEEMAKAVLGEIEAWFERNVFTPLESADDTAGAVEGMFEAVDGYFRSGSRVCLVGALALSDSRDRFAQAVSGYFARWVVALTKALQRQGQDQARARLDAEVVVSGIQGAIVLARALDNPDVFVRALAELKLRLAAS